RPRRIHGLDAIGAGRMRRAHRGDVGVDLLELLGRPRARVALALDGDRHLAPERDLVHAGDERLHAVHAARAERAAVAPALAPGRLLTQPAEESAAARGRCWSLRS